MAKEDDKTHVFDPNKDAVPNMMWENSKNNPQTDTSPHPGQTPEMKS